MCTRTLFLLTLALTSIASAAPAQGFGDAVAISGRDVFVAQAGNQYAPGMVYLYRATPRGTWHLVTKLTAPEATNNDGFGSALAVDGTTLLVSSTTVDSGRGALFVFTRDANGSWRSAGRVVAPDGEAKDAFGGAIALAGDRLYVSSARQKGRGAVYVFARRATTWTPAGSVINPDTAPGQSFGAAIAADGDRLFIGSTEADTNRGAVYVFGRDAAGAWTQQARISPPGMATARGAVFGSSLLVRGDTAFIGAPGDRFAGAVYVYAHDASSDRWSPVTRALPFDGSFNARFGTTIARVGDELWVGAPGTSQFQGRIYRLSRDSTGWTRAAKFGLPQPVERGGFGARFAAAGATAVIGLPNQDFGEGGAAIFTRSTAGAWRLSAQVVGEVATLPALTGAARDCTGNKVGAFSCTQVDLMAFLPVAAVGGKRGIELNDIWGYTDPQTGHEYALVGRLDGTAFVDISDPSRPVFVGQLPKTASAPASIWRDIKTYSHYAFIVADGAREHGMQVFDLDRLRGVQRPPVTFTADAHYTRIHSAHNIVIDTLSGFAYIVGASGGGEMCGGGLHMVDIHDALHPAFAGCFSDPTTGRAGTGYTHDAQCTVYHGPDAKYQGRQICIAANETALSIADVTDKAHPVAISHAPYPNVGYAHQGWLTEDQRYFYQDDELDEMQGLVTGTRTLIWDVSDLGNPVLAGEHVSQNHAIDHNLYIVGNTMYQSNYLSGLRVLDISDRLHPKDIGFFDTVPVGEDAPQFGGSWGNYPFFKSGIVVVTSMREGLFVLKKHPTPAVP